MDISMTEIPASRPTTPESFEMSTDEINVDSSSNRSAHPTENSNRIKLRKYTFQELKHRIATDPLDDGW